ncbi:hypothetical protein Q4497_03645 [Mesomycoplasma ovipneumoniae]|uniref:Uncharacterized protein n=1 Tax=Mesomycoplasma ovipneumoniae TaxID=29562 RepID=A0AAW6Q5L6_9BACT|nr:hypothetical protein [Mesomycoplasma ovipneumoniae]MDF9627731.1 hypothetical protein [Mesomycoplasma ovipneumoniae]MDO4157820.1 hypothetical protein [Mesomycoplasma ovipneumoniae]MDO4158723.1 hypothetical protein [Mesomycoplasma ovipneumoniae]MDO6822105.1 hypothetical protein [Mesomycoplasma ovipneumoniae]MDO6855921.1 hypothetical protein [Mesomycoplasma ovipneumoniae]
MSITNYTTKSKNTTKKNKKIFCSNSSYLFYVFWVIRDFEFKKKGEKCKLFLDVRKILEKLNTNWPVKTWNIKTIYKVLNYLAKENIIEIQKMTNKLIVVSVLDWKKYYIPKKILDLCIGFETLVMANYFRVYQYLKNLAIRNFKFTKWKNNDFQLENSYAYFQNLDLSNETISKALKWFVDNKIQIEFENKVISKKWINSVNLDKNTFYKGIKCEKQLISISLKNVKKTLYRVYQNNKAYFWSKNVFEWKVTKTIVVKFKKIFEYVIKRPCYLLRKLKNGLSYLPCWCKNKGAHWKINHEKPKYRSFYQDKRLIIRHQGYNEAEFLVVDTKLLVLRT